MCCGFSKELSCQDGTLGTNSICLVQMNDYINSSFMRIFYLFGESKSLAIAWLASHENMLKVKKNLIALRI